MKPDARREPDAGPESEFAAHLILYCRADTTDGKSNRVASSCSGHTAATGRGGGACPLHTKNDLLPFFHSAILLP